MSTTTARHPFMAREKPAFTRLFTPTSLGTLMAAAFAAYPSWDMPDTPADSTTLPLDMVPEAFEAFTFIPSKVYVALVGFLVGYLACKWLAWARLRALTTLFYYQGWMQDPKSTKTKIWAILVKLIKGPAPYQTYEFQNLLPNQPLPDLNSTLDRWLKVTSQLVSRQEHASTQQAIELFRRNEGPRLQQFLINKATTEVSWLSDYWLTAAYLSSRDPIAVYSNYFNTLNVPSERTTNQLARAASVTRLLAQFEELTEEGKIEPVQLQDLVPLCMTGGRYLQKTVRIPGENMDTVSQYRDSTHVVVLKDGMYFKMDLYAPDGSAAGQKTLLSAIEIKRQLEKIVQMANEADDSCDVAALTSQNRTQWAKHREVLQKRNAEALLAIESAMFLVCLDNTSSKTASEHSKRCLAGSGNDRWFDKSLTTIISPTGQLGHNLEHSVLDASIFAYACDYVMVQEAFDDKGDIPLKPGELIRKLPDPDRLVWNIGGLEDAITCAMKHYKTEIDNIDIINYNGPYGKRFMKKQRLSPDGYIQMALQLAYYYLYKEVPKTYEPSTGRLYKLGRTETVHPVSNHCCAWLKSMVDPSASNDGRKQHLRKAIEYQNKFRLEATVGQGCDRHLLGLYMASRELGMDVPAIFLDKAWRMPFKLSTSQTPVFLYNYKVDMDYPNVIGGFAPTAPDGYGVSYGLHGEDILNFAISSYNRDETTSSTKFAEALQWSLEAMQRSFQ